MTWNLKKWLPSVLIVFAMVAGGVGAFVAPSNPSPADAGTGATDYGGREPIAATPEMLMTDAELRARLEAAGVDLSQVPDLTDQKSVPDGVTQAAAVEETSPEEIMREVTEGTFTEPVVFEATVPLRRYLEGSDESPSDDAIDGDLSIEVRTRGEDAAPGPEPAAATVDAGGPYGGPGCFEGSCTITFSASVDDPTYVAFRWDLNNDKTWDTDWLFTNELTLPYDDDYIGDIVVEAWDFVTYNTVTLTATNFKEDLSIPIFFGSSNFNFGYIFTARDSLRVTELGYHRYVYPLGRMSLWRSSGTELAACQPGQTSNAWNWCILTTPVNLVIGQQYIISVWNPPGSALLPGQPIPSPNEWVTFGRTYYCIGSQTCFPGNPGNTVYSNKIDMRFQYQRSFPATASDTATLQVENVAPVVFDVEASPGYEGSESLLTGKFSDPGLGDEWLVRYSFPDGTDSGWIPIRKWDGGANVLLLHSLGPDVDTLRGNLAGACGAFCITIDDFEFDDQIGEGAVPPLEELLPYHVIVVATNYFNFNFNEELGDRLAEYMDAGGNVVMAMFAFDNYFDNFYGGCVAGVCGRWQDDGYSPIPRGFPYGPSGFMGTIYSPGHPLLDGVSTVNTNAYSANIFTVTSGATRVVDWNNGRVLAAVKENPMVNNGARAVALNFFPFAAPYNAVSGDWLRLVANAVRWASQQPDLTIKPMPIQLPTYGKAFMDDDPTTTTLEDQVAFLVEVKDDDHGKCYGCPQTLVINEAITGEGFLGTADAVEIWNYGQEAVPMAGWSLYFQDNRGASLSPTYNFPATFTLQPGRSVMIREFSGTNTQDTLYTGFNIWWVHFTPYGGSGTLRPPAGSAHECDFVRWNTNFASAGCAWSGPEFVQDQVIYRRVDVDSDTGADWARSGAGTATPNRLNPGQTGVVPIPPTVRIIEGLGDAPGIVTVINVPPTVVGGATSFQINEAGTVDLNGYRISDPAMMSSEASGRFTEWFAYQWDFDDGTTQSWTYKGTMEPPKLDVLILHSACNPGESCAEFNSWKDNILKVQKNVGTVDTFNIFSPVRWPTLDQLLRYDVIIVTIQWGFFFNPAWDLAREMTANVLAEYAESGRGGVATFTVTYEMLFGLDIWMLKEGTWVCGPSWLTDGECKPEEGYGPYQIPFTASSADNSVLLGEILEPDHDLFNNFVGDLEAYFPYTGRPKLTTGGRILANWDDGGAALGIKESATYRTVHFGNFPIQMLPNFRSTLGKDFNTLTYNMVCYAAGSCPSPRITPLTRQFGDNGVYDVTLRVIDDDMGYTWNFATNEPQLVLPEAFQSERHIPTSVDNTDPVIEGIEAFLAARFCVRVSGTEGGTVTLGVYQDGLLAGGYTTVRAPGDPNPPLEKCSFVAVDLLSPHSFEARLTYTAPAKGGSNPTHLIIAPWKEPVSPGHGTVTYKYDFSSGGTTSVVQDLPTLKTDLLAGGEGAPIQLTATAFDAGTDDLGFVWVRGAPDGTGYDPADPTSAYIIHVYHNDGQAMSNGVLAMPSDIGFSEPAFGKAANDMRSPLGRTMFRVMDTATLALDPNSPVVWIVLIVVDDDVNDGYASGSLNDGSDTEFIVLSLA